MMSDFKQTPPLEQPDDGWYLSDAEMDAMTVEELEAAFALALDSMTEETYDGEVISRYLDALDRKDPMPEYPDAETSYARFQEKMNSIYPDEEPDELITHPRRARRVSRVLLVAALSVVVIFGSLFTAQALGADVFGTLARWTDDFFSFGSIRSDGSSNEVVQDDHVPSAEGISVGEIVASVDTMGEDGYDTAKYASLQEALEAYGFSDVLLAPTWIPEGYEFAGVEVYYDGASSLDFYAIYYEDELFLAVDIVLWEDPSLSYVYSKDDYSVVPYEAGDISHYIMSNNGANMGAWRNGYFECSIAGDITQDEVQKMIDSIYGG